MIRFEHVLCERKAAFSADMPPVAPMVQAPEAKSTPQSHFGKYVLRGLLGSGGMGTVFRATIHVPGGASRQLALKLIHPHLSQDQTFVQLFLDETRVAMALQHRNIVQTFDAGQVSDRHFLAMELIEGCSLRCLLDRAGGPIPLDLALFVAREVCSAVAYAHTFSPELTGQPGAVIHGDLSPTNVLLSNHGDVKITDFGVSRAVDEAKQIATGPIQGKLKYMSPEQAEGRPEPRSDLFAIGTLLYEMLSGRPVRHQPSSITEVREVDPDLVALSELRSDVPAALEQLVRALLDRDPALRPPSAEQLAQQLGEQLMAAQLKSGNTDPHSRLRDYLAQLPPPAPQRQDPMAINVANALIVAAGELESAVGLRPAPDGFVSTQCVPSETSESVSALRARLAAPARWALAVAAISIVVILLSLTWNRNSARSTAPSTPATRSKPLPPVASTSAGDHVAARRDHRNEEPQHIAAPTNKQAPNAGATQHAMPRASSRPNSRGKIPPSRPRRRGRGTLNLNAIPWARVYIDGRYRGNTPLEGFSLPAGAHHVRLLNPEHHLSKTLAIVIRPRRTLLKVVKLYKRAKRQRPGKAPLRRD